MMDDSAKMFKPIPDELTKAFEQKRINDLREAGFHMPMFSVGEVIVFKGVRWEVVEIQEERLVLKPVGRELLNRKERRRQAKVKR